MYYAIYALDCERQDKRNECNAHAHMATHAMHMHTWQPMHTTVAVNIFTFSCRWCSRWSELAYYLIHLDEKKKISVIQMKYIFYYIHGVPKVKTLKMFIATKI